MIISPQSDIDKTIIFQYDGDSEYHGKGGRYETKKTRNKADVCRSHGVRRGLWSSAIRKISKSNCQLFNIRCTSLSERKDKEMKEAYEVAEMEIIEFETEDVITTSGGGQIGGGDEGFGD